ncbi:DNA mismatch repair protein mutS, partial [Thraustotheca clavata]
MLEMANIFDNLNDKSLVIIDELGRGTSSTEGFAVAWTACEFLLNSKAYTLFSTHFHNLTSLTTQFENCRIYHFNSSQAKSEYAYKIKTGPYPISRGYGIEAAKICGMPPQIIYDANIACDTKDIALLNTRIKMCLEEINELSYDVIQAVLVKIRPFATHLYEMVDKIALLDMLLSFTQIAATAPSCQPYCCPQMGLNCNLVIRNGRHPVTEQIM